MSIDRENLVKIYRIFSYFANTQTNTEKDEPVKQNADARFYFCS